MENGYNYMNKKSIEIEINMYTKSILPSQIHWRIISGKILTTCKGGTLKHGGEHLYGMCDCQEGVIPFIE